MFYKKAVVELLNFIKSQPQFKPLNQELQSTTKMGLQSLLGWWITKCDNSGLQSVLGVELQSVAKWITKCVGLQIVAVWITKCVRDYKVWQGELQCALGITKCGGITKWVSTTG